MTLATEEESAIDEFQGQPMVIHTYNHERRLIMPGRAFREASRESSHSNARARVGVHATGCK
jgi:hypothetical protein